MLFLTATTETYRLVTAGAFPTDWAVGYVDLADAGAMPGSAQGSITTATTTTIVTAPASLEQRQVKLITVTNTSASSTQMVTINKVTSSGTYAIVRDIPLGPNKRLVYLDSIGFKVYDASGREEVVTISEVIVDDNTVDMRFDFGDASPRLVTTVPANKVIKAAAIVILEEFDDPTAVLTLGDAIDPDGLIQASDNEPSVEGTYLIAPGLSYGLNTQIFLTISPGTSTSGSGLVTLTFED